MKHTGYTPGPWGFYEGVSDSIYVVDMRNVHIADVANLNDARLIADAPRLAEENERLREALRKLINAAELEGFTEERLDDPLSIAKVVLADQKK